MRTRILAGALSLLALIGCGGGTPATDGGGGNDAARTDGGGGTDARTDAARTDTGVRPDSGSTDPCATDQANATSTLGCNGGFESGEPAANGPGGACTGGGTANPQGTCTAAGAVCSGDMGMPGFCFVTCTAGPQYISTGGCPHGYRCFDLGTNGALCFRDCDATHACQGTLMCDPEGSCD